MCEIAVKNVRKSSFLCYKLIFNTKSFLIYLNSMTTDYKDKVFKLVVKFHRFQDNLHQSQHSEIICD